MKRFLVFIIMLIVIYLGFSWLAIGLGFFYALTLGRSYYEIIFFGIISDILYASFIAVGPALLPIYTLIALTLFGLTTFLQKRIIHHV